MASTARADLDYRPSYLAATITSLLVFLLYIITMSPTTAMWDTSEYLTAAYILGLPHPPGNPLFVLLGRVFAVLPIAPTVAQRVNVLAAICSAASAGFWFLVTERVLVSWFAERWQRVVGGALSALIGSTAFTVWNQSVVNEKVYTVALLGVAVVCWLTVKWCDDPDGLRADRILILIAYLLGLGYANHMAGMLAAPAVAAAVLVRRPRTLLRWKLLVACVGAVVLGMTPFMTQPIRAAQHPELNTGEPTGCVDKLALSCTFSAETKQRFMDNFNRVQYGKPDLSVRQAPFTAQIGMWWFYFKWQWLRSAHDEHDGLQTALAALFLILGLAGGYVHWRHDRASFWFFGPLMFTVTLGLIYYLNFKYGYSQSPELGGTVDREVRDRDYFYLWSFSAWSVWAALGLVYLWETVAALFGADEVKLGKEVVEQPRRRSWMMATPVLAIALFPLVGNWNQASRAGDNFTRDWAIDLLNSVEPYGILITGGDNDTFPLWYAQEVEGVRKDVTVAVTSLLNTDWYVRQIVRRPIYAYEPVKGPVIYRDRSWKKPARPALPLTIAEADAIPPYQELRAPQIFQKDSIVATIKPGILSRDQMIALIMIKESFPERPMYFARSAGAYGQGLGLSDYLVTQGLARRLMPARIKPGKDTVLIPGDGWLDVARTQALWKEFKAPADVIRRDEWVDRASVNVPLGYLFVGGMLAEALGERGDTQGAARLMDTVRQIAKATREEGLLADFSAPTPPPVPLGESTGVKIKP
ncbi:MAG: DUF2723 domain-containing protein [Gemmatimonadota bacterium]|nr:DUF2723 domain-containing protein [Gemmatimonadota bacterium]